MDAIVKRRDFDIRTGEVLHMRLVILESPYNAPTDEQIRANIDYARACVRDCLSRGESPIASHLLFTQPGILKDRDPEERRMGMEAGWAWIIVANGMVVYEDYGISRGMQAGIDKALEVWRAAGQGSKAVEYRKLNENVKYRTA